ncbi:hypothetical protein JQ615_22155 [Bradyrhizobium jicamae]|uniref:Uncharacterized protein n=1 Tax=Bradyrhizobium jicamae TaxID=280332 RepID=A0ABS5FN76_9BRAD|nr:hypothetical protein [Bradyrhizobium jicamae]MBR0798099.1 hypothetical protein [Bradyrhizobium jicamae]MBR0934487.1 hypothetical protein [Bradyrhizobium jicamae]
MVLKFKTIKDLSNKFDRARRPEPRKRNTSKRTKKLHHLSGSQGRKSSSRSKAA